MLDENITGWKKILTKKTSRKSTTILGDDGEDEQLIRDGKFTVAGFLSIFDIFMSKDRWEVPWQILRIFGYDDSLQLLIPASVLSGPTNSTIRGGKDKIAASSWQLSPSAVNFLAASFRQFDSNKDGVLSETDVMVSYYHKLVLEYVLSGIASFLIK